MKRINSTVALTFILLALMFGAGVVSSAWGFAIGREALKGITQPDSRPTNKVNRKNPNGREQLTFLKEDDILATVKSRIGGSSKPSASPNPSSPQSQTGTGKQVATNFPLLVRDRDVALEITGIQQQKDSVTLDVAVKNDSNQAVKFLYSTLNVTDEGGRIISVDTTGLPSEMPAKSDRYTGTVNISAALLANAQKLSLQLTDYPDQKLQLKLSEIPVR